VKTSGNPVKGFPATPKGFVRCTLDKKPLIILFFYPACQLIRSLVTSCHYRRHVLFTSQSQSCSLSPSHVTPMCPLCDTCGHAEHTTQSTSVERHLRAHLFTHPPQGLLVTTPPVLSVLALHVMAYARHFTTVNESYFAAYFAVSRKINWRWDLRCLLRGRSLLSADHLRRTRCHRKEDPP
jgi:hypothetical protein